MALRDFLRVDSPFPVGSDLSEAISETLAENFDGSYDTDQVLFHLAIAVCSLEAELVNTKSDLSNAKAYVLQLEARILDAGLRLEFPDSSIHGD